MPRGTSLYDEARVQGRLWTPRLWLPNTALYLRAEDARGTGANFVWPDLSGNGFNATPYQGAASAAPVFDPVRRGLVFDGKSTILTAPVPFSMFTNGALSIAVLCTAAPQNPYRALAIFRANPSAGAVSTNINADGNRYTYTYGGAYNAPGPQMDGGVMDSVAASFDTYNGTFTERLLVNGTLYSDNSSLSGGAPGTTSVMIGSDPYDTTRVLLGTIYEIFISIRPLSVYQLRMWQGYGFWKYGYQSRILASDPFRNRPPMIGD